MELFGAKNAIYSVQVMTSGHARTTRVLRRTAKGVHRIKKALGGPVWDEHKGCVD